MKFSKILPILFIMLFVFSTIKLSAVETMQDNNNVESVVKEVKIEKASTIKKFFKRLYRKVKEKVIKVKRRIVTKFKRKKSKKKSKKDRTRKSLKHRNSNLYNVLVFLGILLAAAALIYTLLYFSIIALKLAILLGVLLLVVTAVIGLIYFSRRFRVGPRFR